MSSISNSPPEPPAEEELVAYLDGELPPEDCRRVESRLAADAAYRQQLHDLDQAWEALDALPASRADDDFARTTMEMVAVAAEDELSHQAARTATIGRRRAWRLAAAGVAAIAVGFAAMRVLQWRVDAILLADLPVIRQVDLLAHVESIEFLRQLGAGPSLAEWTADEAALRDELLNLAWVNAPDRGDRERWLAARSQDEKAELAAQAGRFRALPRQQRERLRRLQGQIQAAEDNEQLRKTLLSYGQWLSQLTVGEQQELKEELKGLPAAEQVERVRRFARRERLRDSRQLSADDAEKLRRAVLALVAEKRSELLAELRRRGSPERARRLHGPGGSIMVLYWILQNEEQSSEARERIIRTLSAEAQAHLERLGRGGRRAQLWQWIRDSLRPKWGAGELEAFFLEELDNDQRERLLNLPPGEMQTELERLYLESALGFRGGFAPDGRAWNSPTPGWPEFRPDRRPRDRFERGPEERRGPRGEERGRRPPGPPPVRPERGAAI